jgi:hypothetical protein
MLIAEQQTSISLAEAVNEFKKDSAGNSSEIATESPP